MKIVRDRGGAPRKIVHNGAMEPMSRFPPALSLPSVDPTFSFREMDGVIGSLR
jgi:hypothetical protein